MIPESFPNLKFQGRSSIEPLSSSTIVLGEHIGDVCDGTDDGEDYKVYNPSALRLEIDSQVSTLIDSVDDLSVIIIEFAFDHLDAFVFELLLG